MNWQYEDGRIYSKNENNELMAETTFVFIGDNKVIIDHTYVNPVLRGQGIASKMLKVVAEYLRNKRFKATASCSYANAWLKKHKESYSDIISDDIDMQDISIMQYGPDPNAVYPNENIKSVCFIKNVITRPNIIVGEYTYYSDTNGAEQFEDHVKHHYEFLGDKLIIGKFCAIAQGIEFNMNGANHRICSVTTYPFNIMGHGWEKATPALKDLPFKGDTVVGNDVWLGQNVTVMPGVHIGDGAIIAANSVVTKDIPPYHIAGGNPCRIIRKRFDDELIDYLLTIKWWDWPIKKIFDNLEVLCSGDLTKIRETQ